MACRVKFNRRKVTKEDDYIYTLAAQRVCKVVVRFWKINIPSVFYTGSFKGSTISYKKALIKEARIVRKLIREGIIGGNDY